MRPCQVSLQIQSLADGSIHYRICGRPVMRGLMFPACVDCLAMLSRYIACGGAGAFQNSVTVMGAAIAREARS